MVTPGKRSCQREKPFDEPGAREPVTAIDPCSEQSLVLACAALTYAAGQLSCRYDFGVRGGRVKCGHVVPFTVFDYRAALPDC